MMIRLQRLTTRQWMIVAHDLLATIAALVATFLLRFEGHGWNLASDRRMRGGDEREEKEGEASHSRIR